MDRRKFLKIMGAGAAMAAIPWKFNLRQGLKGAQAQAFAQSLFANGVGLTKWADPIPGLGNTGIPVATSDRTHIWPLGRATHYSIDLGQFRQVLHSDFVTSGKPAFIASNWPGTTLWGYGQNGNFKHLGGVIVAQKGKPVQITFTNKLVDKYKRALRNPIPVDVSSFFPDAYPSNRTAVHQQPGAQSPGQKGAGRILLPQ
jgi:spore coat protein A